VAAAAGSAMAVALAVSLALMLTGGAPPANPDPPPRQAVLVSPFTGEPVTALGPVLAVKIDNIAAARPPTGLTSADLVYVLPVEGGLSRIMAVVSSRVPAVIGPVRSAREDDLELLAFSWPASQARWLVSMDGKPARAAEGGQLGAPTVVIQYTKVRTSRFLEAGSRPPYAESTGSGTAVVLRDGLAYDARWSRPAPDAGTTFTVASGQRMTFARGPVWIVLAARK